MRFPPPAPLPTEADVYGEHACALMQRMGEMGTDAAIQAEMENPSYSDHGWCRMVVNLAAHRAAKAARQTNVIQQADRFKKPEVPA